MEKQFDLVIKNARVVRPNKQSVDCLDLAIKDGKIARLSPDIPASQAKEALQDAKGKTLEGRVREALKMLGKK